MTLYGDLLEQARHLATREKKRPRQASLRRSISAAYYGLFHMLISDAVGLLLPGGSPNLRLRAYRAFSHGEMRKACEGFVNGNVINSASRTNLLNLIVPPINNDLRAVARAFVDLQEARHAADYDMMQTYKRVSVLVRIEQAEQAARDWQKVRKSDQARVFLAALFLDAKWSR